MGRRAALSKATYNEMAAVYDSSPEGRYTIPHKAELVRRVSLRDADSVLDVACGNGSLLGALSKKAKVHTYGLDISENMIAAAQARHPAGTFAVGPCHPLPFDSESMNAITVSCAFHHFEDPRAFADESLRVLSAGGKIYLAEPFLRPVIRWLANTMWLPFSKSGDVRVYSRQELRAIFEAAGFRDIESVATGTVLFFSATK